MTNAKRTRELRPVRERPEYFLAIEAEICRAFLREVYYPLMKLFKRGEIQITNSRSVLVDAIDSERIYYEQGMFRGKFSASISKALKELGATWSTRHGSWVIPEGKLGYDITQALLTSRDRVNEMTQRVNEFLGKIKPEEVAEKMKFEKLFDTMIWRVEDDFNETVKSLEVKAQLSREQAADLARKYTNNLRLYIREFTQKETHELRKRVQENSFAGGRYTNIIEDIQKSYGVTQRKAKFLARQETSLLMTSFKEVRYKEAGVNDYKWRCVAGSPAHPVRPYHKALDGTKHTWDNPPIVDAQGHRKHPGQDYNCRCTAIPIVRF